jgi:hypothetical protein
MRICQFFSSYKAYLSKRSAAEPKKRFSTGALFFVLDHFINYSDIDAEVFPSEKSVAFVLGINSLIISC